MEAKPKPRFGAGISLTPRRASLVLVLVAALAIGASVPVLLPAWAWLMTERVYVEESGADHLRGWISVNRWTGEQHGAAVRYYAESGFKECEAMFRDGKCLWHTGWWPDGEVDRQIYGPGKLYSRPRRFSPPWLFGVTRQTTPSMPAWMKDDEKWQAALDAQD